MASSCSIEHAVTVSVSKQAEAPYQTARTRRHFVKQFHCFLLSLGLLIKRIVSKVPFLFPISSTSITVRSLVHVPCIIIELYSITPWLIAEVKGFCRKWRCWSAWVNIGGQSHYIQFCWLDIIRMNTYCSFVHFSFMVQLAAGWMIFQYCLLVNSVS